jgi:hypothetical protein
MSRILLIVTLMAATAGYAHAQTFKKTKWVDFKDKEIAAELTLDSAAKTLTVKPEMGRPIEVSYSSIDKLSYERSSHHRLMSGAIVMAASLGAGAIVMATKSKNHWLYVDYKDSAGMPKDLILKLDKHDYEEILSLASDQVGKDIQRVAEKDSRKPH